MEKEEFVEKHFCAYPSLYISLGGISGTCKQIEHQIGSEIRELFRNNSAIFGENAHMLTSFEKESIQQFSTVYANKEDWKEG
jgi:hypothetical protein